MLLQSPSPPDTPISITTLLPLLLLLAVIILSFLWVVCVLKSRMENPPPEQPKPAVREPAPLVLIVCPYCGAKNEQGLLKCRACGAEM